MTVHLLRDFQTSVTASSPGASAYLLSLFMKHVLLYSVDSHVNFNIMSSSMLLATSTTSDTYTSINVAGSGNEYALIIPAHVYTVSTSDIGRIAALRSQLNPKFNSGLFRVTSASISNNFLYVDYRSPEFPPSETSTLEWKLFENETLIPTFSTGSNGTTGYNSRGSSTASRLMLSSPGGYHVRICIESQVERSGTNPCGLSVAPGSSPNANSDFDTENLLGSMWFNSTSSIYRGTAVGLVPFVTSSGTSTSPVVGQWAMTAIGDDSNGTLLAFTKNISFVTGGNSMLAFGIPEDEQLPISDNAIDRVFVMGYGNVTQNINWTSGYFNDGSVQGMAWSRRGFPSPCVLGSYCDIKNVKQHVRSLSTAADSKHTKTTELIDVDIIAGTFGSLLSPASQAINPMYAQRRVGRFPFARMGRSNYSQWTLSADKSWLHVMSGVYIPWQGPNLSGSLTGSNVTQVLTTSQAAGDGIQFMDLFLPGSDPVVPTSQAQITTTESNKDANRFQKTYSFYRQPSINVGIIKGGSNPSKS